MALFDEKQMQKKVRRSKKEVAATTLFDESNIENKKEIHRKKYKVKSSFIEIAPIIDITANGYFQLNHNEGYFEMVQLTSQDIYSLNESDKDKNIYTLAYFFQWYLNDVKFLPLNFPVDTSTQQQHIRRKLDKTIKKEYRLLLEQKLKELQFIEKERTNREYYLFIYADDEYTLTSRINHIERLLSVVLPVIRLNEEKKINILYKLFNLNSKNKTSKGDV
ncbi:hypothetical protein [Virgibacillus salexigens]|uniref:hypothetical protein n=1 Tax=Virgibacillus massiliensis TaxID=1462526 RepID=UPI00136FB474|nr:hypothetical protein [Virgibacillus massiliensis]MYL43966.1 hypothetical protein [Virgibacillus massiliensis]